MKRLFFIILILSTLIYSQAEEENPYDPTNYKGTSGAILLDDIENINLFNGKSH